MDIATALPNVVSRYDIPARSLGSNRKKEMKAVVHGTSGALVIYPY